ncbi:protein-L-isoaspartate O-methyltransferase family protein [Actinoalloteichus spitiensis]|uniref:protein-L-isoaspartate O-methyltransferase family protein n=1 Tax=Actinoalloteichus spitiensis TaxID=252394 RepID=UPI0003623406|nr:methyltransferase domain-containing protein [Actinoalloteichus spitiensis]
MTRSAIDYDEWTTGDDGEQITQTSAPDIIADLLDLLDVQPADRVLEVGTGSGYSTALLAALTGPAGRVTSVDVDQGLVARASARFTAAGWHHVEVLAGDGLLGAPGRAPFGRIIAWTTPPAIPRAWLDQAEDGAVLVSPVQLAPVAHAHAVLRAEVEAGQLRPRSLHRGSFIESHDRTPEDFRIPTRFVDAVTTDGATPCWLSAAALRGNPGRARALLVDLLGHGVTEAAGTALGGYAERRAALGHVLAADPDRACSAAGPWGRGTGLASGSGVALLTSGGDLVHVGDPAVVDGLRVALRAWTEAGRPDLSAVPPDIRAW